MLLALAKSQFWYADAAHSRTRFEDGELIFDPTRMTWHSRSACIWAEDRIRIPRKVSIATAYASLQDFFVRMLDIRKPNIAMHVQALKEMANKPELIFEIKDTMKIISSMEPSADHLSDLRSSSIFPVNLPGGGGGMTSSLVDFAIIDRQDYDDMFEGITTLDFSPSEIRACRPFLLALGLGRRHMSELVEEKTTVDDGVKSLDLTKVFRSKAYALFRYVLSHNFTTNFHIDVCLIAYSCAINYNSLRARDGDQSLYELLQDTEIFTSNAMFKTITIVQNGVSHTATRRRANLHLDETQGQLRLYVPKHEQYRELCFFRQLPKRLQQLLGISDPTAENVITGIICGGSLFIVDEVLKDAGIIDVPGIERPPDEDEPDEIVEEEVIETTAPLRGAVAAARTAIEHPSEPEESPPGMSPPEMSESVSSQPSRVTTPASSSPSPSAPINRPIQVPDPAGDDRKYAALLERVINAASRKSIPERGGFVADLSIDTSIFATIFNSRSLERDIKVGAAGELFVGALSQFCSQVIDLSRCLSCSAT